MRTSCKAWLLPKVAECGHPIMNGESTPLAAHLPFHLSDDDKTVEFHFVGSNLIARNKRWSSPRKTNDHRSARIYLHWLVRDRWPGSYIKLHRRPLDRTAWVARRSKGFAISSTLRQMRLRQNWPKNLPGKVPKWSQRWWKRWCARQCPVNFIEEAQSTWKLNQNKPTNARLSAADQVKQYNIGSDT